MKKKLLILTGILIIFSLSIYSLADNRDESITFGQIQNIVETYMKEQGIDIPLGTKEFNVFAIEQTTGNIDPALKSHPDHAWIHTYLVRYRIMYSEYLDCKQNFQISTEAGEQLFEYYSEENPCLVYDSKTKELQFVLTKKFLNMTVAERREENKAK